MLSHEGNPGMMEKKNLRASFHNIKKTDGYQAEQLYPGSAFRNSRSPLREGLYVSKKMMEKNLLDKKGAEEGGIIVLELRRVEKKEHSIQRRSHNTAVCNPSLISSVSGRVVRFFFFQFFYSSPTGIRDD